MQQTTFFFKSGYRCVNINIFLPEKSQKYKFVWRRRDIQETSRLGSLLGVSSIQTNLFIKSEYRIN